MELAGTRVLVTGATGFLGSFLVEALVEAGCRVRALGHYRSDQNPGNLAFLDPQVLDAVELVWGDVRDRDSVLSAMRDAEVVFHLAALIGIPYSYHAPRSYIDVNVLGTLNLLQAARELAVRRFVHTSTSEVYGSAQYTPIDEKHPLVAQSPYSASKIAADKLVESFRLSFDLPAVTIRPFNAYGPRQSDRAVVPTILSQRLADVDPLLIGDGSPLRDLTFASDTARAFVQAARCDAAIGQVINIGTGKAVSIEELARVICALTGGGTFRSEENRLRPSASEVRELVCDGKLAEKLLSWHPAVTLKDGLLATAEFIRIHPERYRPSQYVV